MRAVVRIRHHREIPCHVDSGDEYGFDVVSMSCTPSERHPGIVMALRVFFKGGFVFGVLQISVVLGD